MGEDDLCLPDGWRRIYEGPESGKFHYLTRAPQVKIRRRSELEAYQRGGRYLEMKVSDLNFGTKVRNRKYAVAGGDQSQVAMEEEKQLLDSIDKNVETASRNEWSFVGEEKEDSTNVAIEENMMFGKECVEGNAIDKKDLKLENERRKLEKAVQKLTLNKTEEIDHQKDLEDSAKLLNAARSTFDRTDVEIENFSSLRAKLASSRNIQDILGTIRSCPELQFTLSEMEQSKILEQLLRVSSMSDNPLLEFPLDINTNHYAETIAFALKHAPNVLQLILKLSTKNEKPIVESDVVKLAVMFSSLASTVSSKNNALKKVKSISTKNNGLTNAGLDFLSQVGIFESSRTWRNDRDFLASISDSLLLSYARFSVPQVTFDNMDITISNVMHNMTLPFLEFETVDTREFFKS